MCKIHERDFLSNIGVFIIFFKEGIGVFIVTTHLIKSSKNNIN